MTTLQLTQHLVDEIAPLLGMGEANSIARLVLEDVFGWRRGSHPRKLDQDEQILAWTTINRLKAGEPVQYVTGVADFYGLQLKVTPDVLIPRPETEELVEWVLEENGSTTQQVAFDLGTGSGCIPLALKARRPGWKCFGADVSEQALELARENAEKLGLEVGFSRFDLLAEGESIPAPVSLLISNPPYIPPSEREKMGASTLAHEPELALFVPEEDPLLFYRRILEIGHSALAQGGKVYVETNEFNNERVAALFSEAGYTDVERRQDLQGKWRMVRGSRRVSANT
ncbi:peptide chain release factor N(5)-glutamine methyltransferase [Neolewinella agarilytica]|uniref:peptide chain release factor N(5)-glutamine methyltransferase n=1 Tax=Neolewinella agarilytica TaxID=478744 RepID=A0A1H9FKD8_9BACT|nr:peptide chain release factor N(5)-glutamine methyltransferase [Neolewinella agarilytica]SEQ38440.1 release factor glutamine methyltransferase [Neolewinella agarilytica]